MIVGGEVIDTNKYEKRLGIVWTGGNGNIILYIKKSTQIANTHFWVLTTCSKILFQEITIKYTKYEYI